MDLGVTLHLTDRSIDVRDLAVEAEARGFSSLWVPEHTHIPTSRDTPAPSVAEAPEVYPRSPDPWVSLAAAASVTDRIRLGSGVSLVAQHAPLILAKVVASVDALSAGRVSMGVGYGWNREEMAHHGVDYATRRARVREHVLAMQALWAHDEAEFHGEFVDFSSSWSWPKPVQRPGPAVLVGGAAGPRLFDHVAEFAVGWLPIGGAGVRAALATLKEACHRHGRDPADVAVVPFGTIADEGKLDYYAGLGIDEVVLRLPSAGRDVVMTALDGLTRFLT